MGIMVYSLLWGKAGFRLSTVLPTHIYLSSDPPSREARSSPAGSFMAVGLPRFALAGVVAPPSLVESVL